MSSEEKIKIIEEILREKEGFEDSLEFGLSYGQIRHYLDEIEKVIKG